MDSTDFSILANPEEAFFQHGYDDGFAHGHIHGLIEGRALGREKAIELWEEVGYYHGFCLLWNSVLQSRKTDIPSESRAENHLKFLLGAIDRFPLVNPSSLPSDPSTDDALDISKLLAQIRSRYKALCAIVGVKPRLRAIAIGEQELVEETVTPSSGHQRRALTEPSKIWELSNDNTTTPDDEKKSMPPNKPGGGMPLIY